MKKTNNTSAWHVSSVCKDETNTESIEPDLASADDCPSSRHLYKTGEYLLSILSVVHSTMGMEASSHFRWPAEQPAEEDGS